MRFRKEDLQALRPETLLKLCELVGDKEYEKQEKCILTKEFGFLIPYTISNKGVPFIDYPQRVEEFIIEVSNRTRTPEHEVFQFLCYLQQFCDISTYPVLSGAG